ncbi:MAG: thiolase domain-containing protein, partial [Pyrodictiaceae archaeon]
RASYAAHISLDEVLEAKPVIDPLTRYEIAGFTDAAVVFVLASEDIAKNHPHTVWLDGIGWATETGTGGIEWHEWGRMPSIKEAARMAYKQAGIHDPYNETDFAEVEDRFSFMELLALEEAGVAREGMAGDMLEAGDFDPKGDYPVNPSGGSLSIGVPLEATGLSRLLEAVLQLRGRAGPHQLNDVSKALVLSWRGPPTYTSMAAIVSYD